MNCDWKRMEKVICTDHVRNEKSVTWSQVEQEYSSYSKQVKC